MKMKTLIQIVTCASAALVISAVPVFGADGWQQNLEQQWFYMEHDKKAANQWAAWTDGTLRYLGGNGLLVTDNWVNKDGARYRIKEDGSRYENDPRPGIMQETTGKSCSMAGMSWTESIITSTREEIHPERLFLR